MKPGRPALGPTAKSLYIRVRSTPSMMDHLNILRGTSSISDYIRALIAREWKNRGSKD